MSLTILTADELQNLEMRAANQLGADTLMKRAGAAAAELIMKRLEDAGVEQRRVTLLVGPGNNGGDALACACELREKGAVVNVVLPGGRRPTSALALAQLERWTQAGGTTYDDPYMTEKADCVVDGLFGTGLAKPITGDYLDAVLWFNERQALKVSLDIPSGLNPVTGHWTGSYPGCSADVTITFLCVKSGLYMCEGADAAGVALDAGGDVPDVGNLVQTVLLSLYRCPVAGLGGLPHAHVSLGLDVGEARDGAVGAAEVGAVDDDLVTGEDGHRVTVLLVLLDEVAEADVIAGGVLDAGEHALGAELGKELPGELGVNAHGNVVGEDGQVELLVQDAEMLLNLGHALQGIERAGGDKRIGAQLLSDLTVLDHALGLGVDDADQDGNAVVDDADGLGDDLATTLVGGENDLTRRAQEEQAIDAGIDHAVDAALKGGNVELVVFGIGNNDGRDNAGEFLSCHKNLLSCLAGGPMPPTLVGSVLAV